MTLCKWGITWNYTLSLNKQSESLNIPESELLLADAAEAVQLLLDVAVEAAPLVSAAPGSCSPELLYPKRRKNLLRRLRVRETEHLTQILIFLRWYFVPLIFQEKVWKIKGLHHQIPKM